jgi:TRAP-type C4-dicarboxylate transport system substrate-binding protein
MVSRRLGFRGISIAVAMLLGGAFLAGAAEEKITELKLSHWMPPTHPLQKALEDWAASVEQMSNGSILYKIYPAEQLGKAADHYDLVRSGVADAAFIEPANQLSRFPIVAASALPLLIANGKDGSAALDDWYRSYAAPEMSEVKFCFIFVPEPGTLHSRSRKFLEPKDLRGVKIRPSNTMISTFVSRIGAITAPTPEAGARAALESGDLEATASLWDSMSIFGLDSVTKYHLDLPLYVDPLVLVLSKDKYFSLSPAQKKVIDANCSSRQAIKAASAWADGQMAARRALQGKPGHEVYAVAAERADEWRKSAATLYESWALNAAKKGVDTEKAIDDLKAMLAKYKAAY